MGIKGSRGKKTKTGEKIAEFTEKERRKRMSDMALNTPFYNHNIQ